MTTGNNVLDGRVKIKNWKPDTRVSYKDNRNSLISGNYVGRENGHVQIARRLDPSTIGVELIPVIGTEKNPEIDTRDERATMLIITEKLHGERYSLLSSQIGDPQ